jgi:hypothetical protein
MTTIDRATGAADHSFLRPRSLWARGGAVVLAAVWLVVVFAGVMFFGVASPRGGWVYALLCFLPGLVGAARLAGVRRWRDTLLLAVAAALVLGAWAYHLAPPDHGRIKHVAEDVGVPVDGWELVEVDEDGNTWCFKGCPTVTYFYAAEESSGAVVATLDEVLEGHGWSGGAEDRSYGRGEPTEFDPEALGSWRDGRWRVDLRVPSREHRYGWAEEVTARGRTPVEVTFRAAR